MALARYVRRGLAGEMAVLVIVPMMLAAVTLPAEASDAKAHDPWTPGMREVYTDAEKAPVKFRVTSERTILDSGDVEVNQEMLENSHQILVMNYREIRFYTTEPADSPEVDCGGATYIHIDGKVQPVNDNKYVQSEVFEKLFGTDAVVWGDDSGYVYLPQIANDFGAVFTVDDEFEYHVHWKTKFVPDHVSVDNVAVENNGGVWIQRGMSCVGGMFSIGHGLTEESIVQWDNWGGDVAVFIRTSPSVPEPISVHVYEDGLEAGILWGSNPTKPFLVQKAGNMTTMLPSSSLLETTGPYTSKHYVSNPNGPDQAVYEGWRGRNVKISIDSNEVQIDGVPHSLPGTSFVQKGTTMVHIRIVELLPGTYVFWNGRLPNNLGVVELYVSMPIPVDI